VAFEIVMTPRSKAAPGFYHGNVYNPSKSLMKRWAQQAQRFIPERNATYRGAVSLRIEAHYQRPEEHYKRRLRGNDERLTSAAPKFRTYKPDNDNISKFIGDCLTGMAFRDDCQVCDLTVIKRWNHDKDSTKVFIKYLEPERL
jgi:Holliday junction resolvase RusA-like endonuclease